MSKALLILVILSATRSFAANHFVRSAATGNGSGSDWTNAYKDLPNKLIRGVVYYVSSGNYGKHTFNDADSGTLVIEVRAATVADHGTSVGWNDSFMGMAKFQASGSCTAFDDVFEFDTDYYVINGNNRTARDSTWKTSSNYLIRIDN